MTLQHFRLPDVGEGLTEATIATWFVAVGDTVELDSPLCEVETAKSLVELPSPWAGTVRALCVAEGTEVPVGTVLVEVEVEDGAATDAPATRDTDGDRAAEAPVADTPAARDDAVAAQDDDAPALLVGYGVREVPRRRRRVTRPDAVEAPAAARPGSRPEAPESRRGRVLAKPPVRKLAKDLELDLAAIAGSGPGGLVTREDVLAQQVAGDARGLATYEGDEAWLEGGVVEAGGRRTRVPARTVRRRTAEAMVHSAFTAPHVTEFHTVDVTRTVELVSRLRSDREFRDLHVTPLLVAMKALLLAVRRHPQINASWVEESQEIVYKHYVNLGVAAATPRGLVVPNVKDAHRLTLRELAVELGELTEAARAGRTTPAAMSDGTITITNVGAFGIDTGTPILNPGESAILAFGAVRQKPWVHEGELAVRWVTQLALSFDHRLVDGELGSLVLRDVARVLEDPAQALVWG